MRKMFAVLTLLIPVAVLLVPEICSAYITLAQYENAVGHEKELMQIHLSGAGNGLVMANARLKSKKQNVLFCLPDELPTEYFKIVDLALSSNQFNDAQKSLFSTEYALLKIFEEMYPCPSNSKKTKKK